MAVQVGDRIPEVNFKVIGEQGPEDRSASSIFEGRKVVMFAVPGAFTPTCHVKHLPNYVDNADALKAKGVDEIVCVAVNDPFVMKAWGDANNVTGKVTLVADHDASFAKGMGLDFDASAVGLGVRSKRYAMLVDNGVVKALNVEEAPATMELSSAEKILAAI